MDYVRYPWHILILEAFALNMVEGVIFLNFGPTCTARTPQRRVKFEIGRRLISTKSRMRGVDFQ